MICHADVIPQNTPFSAVVCGVQGSGKSHTVSVILETMLVPQYAPIGSLKRPLSALVLHYSNGSPNGLPSEAAYIGVPRSRGIKTPNVHVYVPNSCLETRKRVYASLGANITVAPLLFALVKRSLLPALKQSSKCEKKTLTLLNLPAWNKEWRYLKRSCCRGADNNRALLLAV